MHHSRLIFYVLAAVQIAIVPITSQSHYSIVAPGTIRSNRNYSVCVTLHDAATAATLRLSIRSLSSSMHLSEEVTVQPYESRLINFMPPRLYDQFQYELKVEGIKGITLSESKGLYSLEYGGPRVYIESDKAFYKPNDTVQFRVVILDEHLKITKIFEPIRIQILDPEKNRVKQFKDIQLDRGVYAGKFQISQQPTWGEWTISVFISGKYNMNNEYYFKVQKYVLPKFSVHIEHATNMVTKERFLPVTIYGKYTYGRYVEGIVDVYLEDRIGYTASNITAHIGPGHVKAEVLLDIDELSSAGLLYIRAQLRERHSNVTAQADSQVILQRDPYNIFLPHSEIEFRQGKPYRFNVHVEQWNGTPVKDSQTAVEMFINEKKYSSVLNENGVAQFQVDADNIPNYRFEYKEAILRLNSMFGEEHSYVYDESNCKIKVLPRGSLDLKDPLEIVITSNENIPYAIYTLTSHGNIIDQKYIPPLETPRKSLKITITPTVAMVPNSYLFVYYIVNGDLHYCEHTLRLPELFENQLTIDAPRNVKPGQNITFNIKGQPRSRVSIVAVDKSVMLLSARNILRKQTVMRDLRIDKAYRQQYPNPHVYEYTPGHTSGLIIFTNAKYKIHTFNIPREPLPSYLPDYKRQVFPETWIFKDIDVFEPVTALTFKVPDTITTWIVRAFSVNDDSGFGMLDDSLDIEAFQPFFISVNLPYAVKRGEIVTIPVTIFNYLSEQLETEVKMLNTKEEFQFTNNRQQPLQIKEEMRKLTIPPNGGGSTFFTIAPQKIGHIEIYIEARNSITSDTVIHQLKVEPEGIGHEGNQDELVTVSHDKSTKRTFEANIPTNIVPDSEYLVLTISGDVMATTVENLGKLVQKPSGCGEQNMINMVPNILILDYLKNLNQYKNKTTLVERAKNFIDTGYQRELSFRHPNGAYSVFGPSSSTENNWLTAYVTRFFIKGQKYSAIEGRIIESGLEYLSGQQLDDGSFPHRGFLFDPSHQNEYGFTAFCLLTFLEDPKYSKKYNSLIQKGITYLKNNLNKVKDTYSLAIMANTFQKAGSSSDANTILEKLKRIARQDNDLKWWTKNNKNEESANDVEITSYILMALLESSSQEDSTAIYNWLLKQRNANGGFGSTQDTVLGLQALIKFVEKSSQIQNTDLKVYFVAKCGEGKTHKEGTFTVGLDNELILQKEELPRNIRSVAVEIRGNGRVYVQLSYKYYTSQDVTGPGGTLATGESERTPISFPPRMIEHTSGTSRKPPLTSERTPISYRPRMGEPTSGSSRIPALASHLGSGAQPPLASALVHKYFNIKPQAKISSPNAMSLEICYSYRPYTEEEKLTNMVILEITFPSGYIANGENLDRLRDEEQVSRVDSQNSETLIAIYFEKLSANDEQCLTAVADKVHDVAGLKPTKIDMYDFYNDKRRTTILYELK